VCTFNTGTTDGDCQTSNPCRNNATCIDHQDDNVTCECWPPWTGAHCDQVSHLFARRSLYNFHYTDASSTNRSTHVFECLGHFLDLITTLQILPDCTMLYGMPTCTFSVNFRYSVDTKKQKLKNVSSKTISYTTKHR